MVDFATLRKNMVFGQLLPNQISHPLLLRAFETVPREEFCPKNRASLAYTDGVVCLSDTRFMLAPLALAKLIAALDIQLTDKVLDVGCGMGYSAAILNFLSSSVTGIEQDAHLFQKEIEHLYDLGYQIELHQSNFLEGWQNAAPYDIILVEGALSEIPTSLADQLKEGGKLGLFLKSTEATLAQAVLVQKVKKTFTTTALFEHEAPYILAPMSDSPSPWSDFYAE